MLSVALLASGSGSNVQVLLDAMASDPGFGAKPVAVISDRPDAHALQRAEAAGVESHVIDYGAYPDRDAFTVAICDLADAVGAEALVLAGFMRILGPDAVRRFPNRIINIHPALLPSFRGAHAVEDALAAGVRVTGVTVHFVDELVDHGPIIAQEAVAVEEDDDVASLHARLQEVEHRLFPEVLKAFALGRLTVEGSRVRWT